MLPNGQRKLFSSVFPAASKMHFLLGCARQGVGFWEVYMPGQDAPASEGGGRGVYGIYPTDDTFNLISQEASSLHARAAAVPHCDATSNLAPLPAVQDCSSRQVNGLNGTG